MMMHRASHRASHFVKQPSLDVLPDVRTTVAELQSGAASSLA